MRIAIQTIFDEITNQGISFDNIRIELKKIVLQNLKKRSPDQVILKVTNISLDIITAGFDKEALFSGNIDGKLIRETANKYGFSYQTNYAKTRNGEDLVIVKANRNDLAHGIKSFAEVGRDYSMDELIKIKKQVIKYLRQILQNIERYLKNKEYLDHP